jgi:hypothetical protein
MYVGSMINEAVEELKRELRKADGGTLRPSIEEDLAQARRFGFPNVLLDFYRDNAPDPRDGRVELDQRIWSVQNAMTENRDYVPGAYLFPLGYVVFASNKFGDAYCLDTVHCSSSAECPVVLLPHDVIEDGATLESVEKYPLTVADNLENFIRQFARRTLVEKAKYE